MDLNFNRHLSCYESLERTAHEKLYDKTVSDSRKDFFSFLVNKEAEKIRCPYSYLAKDGIIEYNGVIFVCDALTNSICLGNMDDTKHVLNIRLKSGGYLKLNTNNIDEFSKAASMFTPEDLKVIMDAIAQYNHCQRKLEEIENEKSKIMGSAKGSRTGKTGK